MTEDVLENIKKAYLKGCTYNEISNKYKITYNQLIYAIKKYKWKRKSNRKKVQKGNKNAIGNKGGHAPKNNKNAVVTGAYSKFNDCFTAEELAIFQEEEEILNKKQALEKEIRLLKVREYRIQKKITKLQESKDLTIIRMTKYRNSASTEAENTDLLLLRFEDALTRVQEAKRRAIDSLHKIDIEDQRIELEKAKDDVDKENFDNAKDILIKIREVAENDTSN